MSILGVGLDLCDIRRIRRAMENPRFAQRAFTQGERERIAQRGEQTAAGLFAAKEAVAKALGTGFDGFFLDKVEVYWDRLGCPHCRLYGGALERLRAMGGGTIRLSITHQGEMAAAVAVVEEARKTELGETQPRAMEPPGTKPREAETDFA